MYKNKLPCLFELKIWSPLGSCLRVCPRYVCLDLALSRGEL